MTVTYDPESNKLRLYVGRVPRDEYERLRAAGFISTPKQNCDFVATWTPAREDLASEYLEDGEDIGDEDYSPEERAADRAERFEGYREKRADEAGGLADSFEAGPSAFGHQNEQRAARQARRHDRLRVHAVSQWSKAEYWQSRTAGVIRHALHKSSASVRRGRILTLEAEQRKQLKSIEEAQARFDLWSKVSEKDGADEVLPLDREDMKAAQVLAYTLANHSGGWVEFDHPTCEEANAKAREIHGQHYRGFSPYDLLTKTEYLGCQFDRLTPRQLAGLYLAAVRDPSEIGTSSQRWAAHYAFRLEYERALLAEEGGTAAEADIEAGGWIRPTSRVAWMIRGAGGQWLQVQKVNKSPATGRVTSVGIHAPSSANYDRHGKPFTEENPRPMTLHTMPVERLAEDAYRPPTDEERTQFTATKKANKPAPVPTINPTNEDAARFQAILNERAAESAKAKRGSYGSDRPTVRDVKEMTQAEYSRNSGPESMYLIREITSFGSPFKVRMRRAGYCDYNAAESVIVLTDKPQKPLPIDWDAVEAKAGELVTA